MKIERGDFVNIRKFEDSYKISGVYVGDNLDGSVQIQCPPEQEGGKGEVQKGDPEHATVVEDDDLYRITLKFVEEQRKTIFIP